MNMKSFIVIMTNWSIINHEVVSIILWILLLLRYSYSYSYFFLYYYINKLSLSSLSLFVFCFRPGLSPWEVWDLFLNAFDDDD